MPKFVTIGYGDQEGYDSTPAAIRDAAHAHDAKLRQDGVLMGIAGIPVQIRNPNGAQLEKTNGPFMTSALPLGWFCHHRSRQFGGGLLTSYHERPAPLPMASLRSGR